MWRALKEGQDAVIPHPYYHSLNLISLITDYLAEWELVLKLNKNIKQFAKRWASFLERFYTNQEINPFVRDPVIYQETLLLELDELEPPNISVRSSEKSE